MKRSPTKKSEATRAHILRCALDLFNDRGASAVSTHDIAQAAGLSPGNLYYHFRNKEEIIRSIFARIPMFSPESWKQALAGGDSKGFYVFVDFYFSQLTQYRFLFREQMMLMRNDNVLSEKWRVAHAHLRHVMREAVAHWVEGGIMKPFASAEEVDAFIDNSWIILNFVHLYFETRDKAGAGATDEVLNRQMIAFLRPYHTAKGLRILDRFLKERR